ncbi:ribonuclease HII [Glutamicibacter nicotianae]|uniref:ribonuclease HII n=1 Tax=Glutamicibacter nicotianae TaxID=37929 RepID=UPI00195D95B6|nr:ribonuclease HII [Glutamicibacter nicotianae]MBM7768348.1 ribonuclease HII [Glutamicibacter nicotianae]
MADSKSKATTLEHERALAAKHGVRYIAAVDEVGRGALAGPITVGMTVIDIQQVNEFPELRDSKLLSPETRMSLVDPVRQWAVGYGVGHASAAEIDELGVTGALRLAGTRAMTQCAVQPEAALLDGSYDWLTAPEPDLFDILADDREPVGLHIPVATIVKGDMTCQAIAGASILAKVERDGIMVGLATEHPNFGWEINKGYATAAHRAAIVLQGPCDYHRKSWNLTSGADQAQGEATTKKAK